MRPARLIGLLLLLPAAIGWGQKTEELTPKQVFEKCHDSVVTVLTDTSQGTGFFVRNNLLVATCYHVIKNAKSIEIQGTKGAKWKVGAVYFDKSCDAAILKLTDPSDRKPLALGEFAKIETGDPLYVIGNPLGLDQTLTNGIVSAKRKDGDVDLIQTTAAISHGSSGSPVLNAQGQFVGFAIFQFTEGQLLNMAVSSSAVVRLWADDPIPISTFYASARTEPSSKDGKEDSGKGKEKDKEYVPKYAKSEAMEILRKEFPKAYSKLGTHIMQWDVAWDHECNKYPHDADAYKIKVEKIIDQILEDYFSDDFNQALIDAKFDTKVFDDVANPLLEVLKSMEALLDTQEESLRATMAGKGEEAADAKERAAFRDVHDQFYFLGRGYTKAANITINQFRQMILPTVVYGFFGSGLKGIEPDPDRPNGCYVGRSTAKGGPSIGSKITGIRRASDPKLTLVSGWLELQDFLVELDKSVQSVYVKTDEGEFLVTITRPTTVK